MDDSAHLRIGVLSGRVGVSPGLLRAWERRYGLLQPSRSAGGFRLYSGADEARGPVDAALPRSRAVSGRGGTSRGRRRRIASRWRGLEPAKRGYTELAAELEAALGRFDESAAHAAFDRLFYGVQAPDGAARSGAPVSRMTSVRRWERGDASVAQEHFASNLLRGRLLGLARGWADATGPRGGFSRVRRASSMTCR